MDILEHVNQFRLDSLISRNSSWIGINSNFSSFLWFLCTAREICRAAKHAIGVWPQLPFYQIYRWMVRTATPNGVPWWNDRRTKTQNRKRDRMHQWPMTAVWRMKCLPNQRRRWQNPNHTNPKHEPSMVLVRIGCPKVQIQIVWKRACSQHHWEIGELINS